MTLAQFTPHARRFWDLTRTGGLRAFLDRWPEQLESDREAFTAFVVALRKAFSGRRYSLEMDALRSDENPAWTELALGLRKGRIVGLEEAGDG